MSPKFCAGCGAAIVSGVCSGCGAPVARPQDSGVSYTEASYASSYLDPPPPPPPSAPPAPPVTSPGSGSRPGLLVVLVVAGVLLLGAVIGVFSVLLRNQNGTDVAASRTPTQGSQAQGIPAPQDGGGGEAVPPPVAQADVVTDSTWVLVLESYEQDRYSLDYARARAAEISPGTLVLDSSATVGMNSGYWAVVYGSWSNKEAARDSCYQVGRSAGGTCYPRHLN